MTNDENNEPDEMSVDELSSRLFECADDMRGSIAKGRYKDFILPLVFLAGVSKQFDKEMQDEIQNYEDLHYKDASVLNEDGEEATEMTEAMYDTVADSTESGVEIPKGHHWVDVRTTTKGVGKTIDNALAEFEKTNPEYEGAFQNEYSNVESFTDSSGDSDGCVMTIVVLSAFGSLRSPTRMVG